MKGTKVVAAGPRLHRFRQRGQATLARAGLWAAGLGVALTGACQPDKITPPNPDMKATPGTLALGTIDVARFGDTRWVDLNDGQPVELVPGAQGGFHVWVLYRTHGFAGRVQVSRIANRVPTDGSPIQRVLTTSGFITIPEGDSWTSDPVPSFMCPTPIGVSVLSAPIEISVRMTDPDDPQLTLAEKTVRIAEQCPPVSDVTHDFCLRICQGTK